jgi:flagellar protein FlgJ
MPRPFHRVLHGVLVAACAAGPTAVAVVPSLPASAATRIGVVRVGGTLNVRSGPSTAAAAVGTLRDGARVRIACAVSGERVNGTVRTSAQWDRLSGGRYIAHAYVRSSTLPRCAGPAPTAPVAMTNAQFIARAVPGARKGQRKYGVPASVTIAQAILESGWGRSALSSTDRNYFGIKCFGGPGPVASGCHTYRTRECDKAGRCFTTSASFRTYARAADSFVDHGHFLRHNSRYRPAFRHSDKPDEFARQIWKAGYATDPKYVAKLTGLMKTYRLYRYDR